MASPYLEPLREALWAPARGGHRGDVYALLDGARDTRIHTILRRSYVDSRCLYSGDLPPELAEVAPYLVPLARDSAMLARLIELGWGRSWGVFLEAPDHLSDLRRHFRRFLRVRDEGGRRLIFRFYDPRVLRAYLPTCTPEEARFVFGPVGRYLVEGEDPGTLIEIRREGTALTRRLGDLRAPGGPVAWGPQERVGVGSGVRGVLEDRGLLIIRDAQFAALRRNVEEKFLDELVEELRARHADAVGAFDRRELRRRVGRGVRRARGYGLERKFTIAMFVHLMFLVAPNFDEYPPVRFRLRDARFAPDARMDRLLDAMTGRQWEGARRRSDPRAWDD